MKTKVNIVRRMWSSLRFPLQVAAVAPLLSVIRASAQEVAVQQQKQQQQQQEEATNTVDPANPVNASISVMLLGSIGFQMLLFYLVNWPDRDIRRYSWQVISQTISIFCAVLLFQAFNGIVEDYIIEGGSMLWEVGVDMMQLVFWLTALQFVLAFTSGAINDLWGGEAPAVEVVELRVKSWALLFSHLAGFAAINGWGSLQQQMLNDSPLVAAAIVPIGWVGLLVMYKGYDIVRESVSRMDDGEKDELETLWDEETEEAEHDIAGLSLSFLMVQALRFHISGVLPDQEGIEDGHIATSHSAWQCKILFGCGLVSFVLSLMPLLLESRFQASIHDFEESTQELVARVTEIWNNFFTFGNAWCLFYGTKWALASSDLSSEDALLGVVLALVLSATSFLFIFLLDKMVDHHLLGEESEVADAAIEKLITALGVLVGFSWEQSFDVAVDVVAESNEERMPPAFSKMLMSVLLVLIVFPAWRLYILRTERDLAEDDLDEGRLKLKVLCEQQRDLLLNKEVEERTLDLAHLRMKQYRREALGSHSTAHSALCAGRKHLRVTVGGIAEVEAPVESRKRATTRHSEITQSLLG
eukprot:CAMPEP_0206459302 /NCGR_PEP_ID=MMETSP0324_2-20121206/24097_1 /ASSEMBLY_ACC=CAM_ASM_000836 /TAXON_ID=2866 /ORGANISM="Crypthecodinium cohnii, Strain Seligo" /LENGTH=584 /DNA_ID=CAMNT_0053930831 /DNA_START=33 /DNA_END=1787 /DNA_ORIENTATION=-